MRHKKVVRRKAKPDVIYNNVMVAKFTNCLMYNGKKSAAQKMVYMAFDKIKEQGHEPIDVFEKALQAIGPKSEVKARRVGGASYQIPVEVRNDRRISLAVRWIIEAARYTSNKEYHSFSDKLAQELLEAAQGQGEAAKKRDTMHRQAEANKAFAHFRW